MYVKIAFLYILYYFTLFCNGEKPYKTFSKLSALSLCYNVTILYHTYDIIIGFNYCDNTNIKY